MTLKYYTLKQYLPEEGEILKFIPDKSIYGNCDCYIKVIKVCPPKESYLKYPHTCVGPYLYYNPICRGSRASKNCTLLLCNNATLLGDKIFRKLTEKDYAKIMRYLMVGK